MGTYFRDFSRGNGLVPDSTHLLVCLFFVFFFSCCNSESWGLRVTPLRSSFKCKGDKCRLHKQPSQMSHGDTAIYEDSRRSLSWLLSSKAGLTSELCHLRNMDARTYFKEKKSPRDRSIVSWKGNCCVSKHETLNSSRRESHSSWTRLSPSDLDAGHTSKS